VSSGGPAPTVETVVSWLQDQRYGTAVKFCLLKFSCVCVFRCNNVLYIRGVEDEDEEGEMRE